MTQTAATHIIAAIGPHAKTGVLLKTAQRRAAELGQNWSVIYVETPAHFIQESDVQQRIVRYMTMAEEMGATVIKLEAETIEAGLIRHMQTLADSKTVLVMGKSTGGNHHRFWNRSLSDKIAPSLPANCEIFAIPLSGRSPITGNWWDPLRLRSVRLRHIAYALLGVLLAYLCAEAMNATMTHSDFAVNVYNLSILFMLPIVIAAGRYGLIPGLVAATGSFFTMNYFYVHPINTLDLTKYLDFVNAVLFIAVAIIVALFTSYTHAHAEMSRKRTRRTQALFAINEVISSSFTRQQALENIYREVHDLLEMDMALFLPPILNPDVIELVYPSASEVILNEYEQDALRISWHDVCSSGHATPRYNNTQWRFEPMISGQDRVGVLAVKVPPKMNLDASFGQLAAALADQAGNVLERIEMSKTMEAQRLSEEREKLRSMLLSSVSHDLKTPLASIIGSLSVYQGMYDVLPPDKRAELIETALDEAQRLDSFITNILDMTRLESGQIRFKQEWIRPQDMVNQVIKRLRQRLRHHIVEVTPLEAEIEVLADNVMTEQVLQNLLDNAAKYTPTRSHIYVTMQADENGFSLSVRDTGKGIPEGREDKIFDKYERIAQKDTKVAGTGLGLAIAKAILQGQNGSISVHNHADGGAVFTIHLPEYRLIETRKEAVS